MDGNPINFTDIRGLYVDHGDGSYSLEKDETVGEMYDKLANEGKTHYSYDEFATKNELNRSTGLINGGVVKNTTKFKVKDDRPDEIKDDQEEVNLSKEENWEFLIRHELSDETWDDATERSGVEMQKQPIENAYGDDLNLDLYSMEITKLPNVINTKEELLVKVREIFSTLTEGDGTDFEPLNNEEDAIFKSENSLGALMRFEVNIAEHLSVICTASESDYWVFSTIRTPYLDWGHAVSENRMFGVKNTGSDGAIEFYIMGADRAAAVFDDDLGDVLWNGADGLWKVVMKNVVEYVNSNGGSATVNKSISKRVKWKDYK